MTNQRPAESLDDHHPLQFEEATHHPLTVPIEIGPSRRELGPSSKRLNPAVSSSALSPPILHDVAVAVQEDEKLDQDDVHIPSSRQAEQEGMDADALQQIMTR